MIVGGANYIGAHLAHYLVSKYNDHRLIIVDKPGDFSSRLLADSGVLCEHIDSSSIMELDRLFKLNKPNIVINITTYTAQDTKFLYNLVDCCETSSIDRLVHLSTGKVYGPYRKRSFETDAVNPKDSITADVVMAENIIRSTSLLKNIPALTVRSSNIYGEKQDSGVIPSLIAAASSDDFLIIPNDGRSSRDWLHIDDYCTAIDKLMYFGNVHEIYNVGSGQSMTDRDLAVMILSHFNLPFSMVDYDDSAFSSACDTILDIGKMKKLGWSPTLEFEDRFPSVIKSYTRR